jgi:hypothetical protein
MTRKRKPPPSAADAAAAMAGNDKTNGGNGSSPAPGNEPPAEPAPLNPVSHLLIQLSHIFAAVPQTVKDERAAFIMAQVEMARFVRGAARETQDMSLWEAQLRLSELAWALSDLDNGRTAPVLERTKRKAGSAPDGSVKWTKRVRVLAIQYALHQSGMAMEAAAKDIAARRPDLERLMTRGKNLPDTILNWRRKLEEAQSGDFLWKFSRQMLDMEETLRRLVQSTEWRQRAYILLARIRP